jgi:hypothetical protein
MRKGYATFNHPLFVHGSFELNVFANGISSRSNEEMLVGITAIKSGNKLENKFFQLLSAIQITNVINH